MSQKLVGKQTKQIPLEELVEKIQTPKDLSQFIQALHAAFKEKPGEWENAELGPYLEAIGAWVHDMEGYFKSRAEAVPNQPTWKILGQILLAAKMYE
jgi:hypothetical protein